MSHEYLFSTIPPLVTHCLADESLTEIMLNPCGDLWCFGCEQQYFCVGHVDQSSAQQFVYAVAQFSDQLLNEKRPFLDAQLPFGGERINVTIAPISDGVAFNIRKHSTRNFSLADFCERKIFSRDQYEFLINAVRGRKNILVSGGPGAGKTTFANALLNQIALDCEHGERVLILEHVPELRCEIPNIKFMKTSEHVDINRLLWIAMRNTPDRIVVGEVRDGAAYTLLKAWNTGCRGGIATIHANSAHAAIQRLIDLSLEAIPQPPHRLIREAVDLIVHIERDDTHQCGRRVTEIFWVRGSNDYLGENHE